MKQLLWVGIGGGIGAMARFKLGGWVLQAVPAAVFPWGTFAVNVIGCLAAGILAALAEKHGQFNPDLRLFLFTGILGGFTTFSAFGLETIHLLQRHQTGAAAANVMLSVGCGLLAFWLGSKLIA